MEHGRALPTGRPTLAPPGAAWPRRRALALATLLLVAGSGLQAARAQVSPGASGAPVDAREMRAWLMRIHQAAKERNFQGTFVVSGAGGVASARIAHYWDGPNQFERIESLDGQARHVFRHNDLVHTVWPQSRVVRVEQRNLMMSFPALLQAGDDRIADFYEVQQLGAERVAGHEANVLLVRPRDGYRFGYRLWAEKNSGLLLRADVLGEHGEPLETSAFSSVVIGVRPQPETVLHPMKRLDGYRVVRPVLSPTTLDVEGWSMRKATPGFRLVSCVRRPLDDYQPGDGASPSEEAVQTIFADGLTHVSVFIEAFNPQRHTRPMLASVGATQTLMRRHADWWVTVVGDVPTVTLRSFVNALERKK